MPEPVAPRPDPDFPRAPLSPAQAEAVSALVAPFPWDRPQPQEADDLRPVLLEGVTGSGKTEVYFEAVAACIRAGRLQSEVHPLSRSIETLRIVEAATKAAEG